MTWRAVLPELVAEGSYRTQGELQHALDERGLRVDQAAISRELRLLGVVKVGGVYRIPAVAGERPLLRHHVTAMGCLAVLVTEPAWATPLAQEVDQAELDGVLGTIAGDDTVFVATAGPEATSRLLSWLGLPPRP